MSPRRSSRARTTNPAPSAATTNSSTSSISSGRAERSTRSHNKVSSPQRSVPRSQSIDDPEDAVKPPPRRTRSGHEDIKEPLEIPQDDEVDDEDVDEVTRCVCGQTEYPGLPGPTQDALKQQAKDNGSSTSSDALADDGAGIFIQCDVCKVWQHGGCVGILDDNSAPENYFCEECQKDLHQVATTSTGQRYSKYLPLQSNRSPTASPVAQTRDNMSRRSKENKPRASAEALMAKRRPTMNSYDEQEQLQRAIEESKKDGVNGSEDGIRRLKRSRSDSEERKAPTKRQRTGSGSTSPDVEKSGAVVSSEDEALALHKTTDASPKKIRGAAARNHREKELREQRERERVEQATRRKARSERRRGDESDPEDPTTNLPASALSTPPAPDPAPRSHKKKTANKGRRVGRNQYTRDQLPPSSLHHSLDPNEEAQMRTRSRSRSVARDPESPSGTNGNGHNGGNGGHGSNLGVDRPSRPKHMNPNRTSLNEMKKRVAGILEFVNRAHEEHPKPGDEKDSGEKKKEKKTESGHKDGEGKGKQPTPVVNVNRNSANGKVDEKEFASLHAVEMLSNLRQDLVAWQDEYGPWNRA